LFEQSSSLQSLAKLFKFDLMGFDIWTGREARRLDKFRAEKRLVEKGLTRHEMDLETLDAGRKSRSKKKKNGDRACGLISPLLSFLFLFPLLRCRDDGQAAHTVLYCNTRATFGCAR